MNPSSSSQNNQVVSDNEYNAAERLGRIVAVTGGKAVVLMDTLDQHSNDTRHRAEIGTLLKVEGPNSISLALVSALSSPMPTHSTGDSHNASQTFGCIIV